MSFVLSDPRVPSRSRSRVIASLLRSPANRDSACPAILTVATRGQQRHVLRRSLAGKCGGLVPGRPRPRLDLGTCNCLWRGHSLFLTLWAPSGVLWGPFPSEISFPSSSPFLFVSQSLNRLAGSHQLFKHQVNHIVGRGDPGKFLSAEYPHLSGHLPHHQALVGGDRETFS